MFNDSHPSIDRAEAMRPSSFQESTSPPNPSAILTVPRYFYFPRHMRIFFSLAPVVPVTLLFSQQILPFKISQMPTEGIIVLAVLLIVFFLLTIFVAWRIWQPLLTLSINGIEQKPFFKTNFVPWSSIQGMTVSEITIHGKIKEMVKLVIATEKGGTRESTICTYGLEGGEEALSILRKIVPEKKAGDFFRTPKQMKPLQTDAMRYRDIEVSCEGIVFKGERIPWDSIINLSTEGMVIAGYGSISVEYSGTGKRNKFIIRASITDDYLDCVKLILSRAKNAVVDPGMIAMLGYPPAAAKKDICAVVLIATGVLLAFGGLIVLSFYPPTVASTWLYPLLLLPLAIAPLVWTIKLLSARFERGTADSTRKIIGAALVNLGTIFAVAILFSLSPASFLWLMADTAVLTGHMAQAEELYVKAEPTLGKNEDFIFTLGQFYFRKGDWNRAAAYYIRSYDKDPTNWMTEPLAKIPDSLTKAGRHEEALQWCERIIKQYAGNRQVTSMIEKKKMEIIRILGEKQS
ncbi:MAG: hypothetical protein ABFD50_20545 [Smithella sp.]